MIYEIIKTCNSGIVNDQNNESNARGMYLTDLLRKDLPLETNCCYRKENV